jgi:NTE family protein
MKRLLLTLLLILTSCSGNPFHLPEKPSPIPERSCPNDAKIALVLGGGGAKGLAHVGVLEELEAAGIKVDVIIGCSAGAVVGALYADCQDARRLKDILEPLKKWDILDISFLKCRYGLVEGRSLKRFLIKHLSCKNFEELQIPLYVVATDLIAGELVCFSTGQIVPAVYASSAIPFVFCPLIFHERLLVDGGVVDPVPVQVAKKLGASVIIAVDLSDLLPETCPSNLFGVAIRSAEIKFLLQSESCVNGADVVIKPDLGDIGAFDDTNLGHVYRAGRRAGNKAIPLILEVLERKDLLECPLTN